MRIFAGIDDRAPDPYGGTVGQPASAEARAAALAVLRRGGGHAAAARAAGVTEWATLRWARKWRASGELERPAHPTAPKGSTTARVVAFEALSAGCSQREAARMAGVSVNTVRRWIAAGQNRAVSQALPMSLAVLVAAARCWAEGRADHPGSASDRPPVTAAQLEQARSDRRWPIVLAAVRTFEARVMAARRRRGRAAAREVEHVVQAAERYAAVPYAVTAE